MFVDVTDFLARWGTETKTRGHMTVSRGSQMSVALSRNFRGLPHITLLLMNSRKACKPRDIGPYSSSRLWVWVNRTGKSRI